MIDTRKEAYKIVLNVLKKNIFSDKLLHQFAKKINSADTNAEQLYTLVKGTIKMKGTLDYIVRQFTDAKRFDTTNIKIKVLLYLALYQIIYMDSVPSHAAVNEFVELSKKLFDSKVSSFVNAILRSYLRNPVINYPTDTISRIAVEHSFPEEIVSDWLKTWGEEDTEYLCMHFNEPPKIHIRVNNLATNRNKLLSYLQRKDIVVSYSNYSKNMFVSESPQEVLHDVAFEEGYFTIQDTSAALVVELMNPKEDESILDLFAAPGGKATYIAEMMNNTGEIIAVDKIPNKIKKMKQAVNRLQIFNMKLHAMDAFKYGPVAPAFDKVLIDVPCSGWGVFQKKSELRWQTNQDISSLIKIQQDALDYAKKFVKLDGYLIYSTCTMNYEENEKQIEKFLSQNSDFQLLDAADYVNPECTHEKYLKTIPHKHNMDGAFAAKLQKIR